MKSLIKFLKNKLGRGFGKNLITLVSGTTVAQFLPVLISPILSRLYTPDDFGILTVFVSLSLIIGSVANLKYEMAVMLPEKKEDAVNIVALGMFITVAITLLSALFLLFFHDTVIGWLGEDRLSGWIYMLPLVVLLVGMYNMLNYYNTRIKKYRTIAFSRVMKAVAMATVQLGGGAIKFGFGGLILGFGISHIFGNYRLLKNYTNDKEALQQVKKEEMKRLAKRYKRFPYFTFPATLANKLATDLTNVLISIVFNVTTLGLYSYTLRMLALPSSLIGTSIGQLYMQEAAEERNKTGQAMKTFRAMLLRLALIGLPVFGVIFIFAEPAFAFVFGEQWRLAGVYAQYVIPLLYIRFVVAPVAVSLSVFEKQPLALILQTGLLVVTLAVIGAAFYLDWSFIRFLTIYTVSLSIYYLFYLVNLYRVVKGPAVKSID